MTTDAQCKQETTGSQETADDIRKSLSRRALEYSRFGHESACQDWRDLETKLRGLAGISPTRCSNDHRSPQLRHSLGGQHE